MSGEPVRPGRGDITLTRGEVYELLDTLELATRVLDGREPFDERILWLNDVADLLRDRLWPA